MSVNSYLKTLASDLVLSDEEKTSIKTSINAINTRLDFCFSDITEKMVFGSYARGTILPRKADSKSDIDLMIVFSNPYGYKPQSFLNRLKNFAERYYPCSIVYQSSPTIVLELNHIRFELIPAINSYGCYYIPSGPSDWMYTDPNGFASKLMNCNVKNNSMVKPIIRLIKHWNINKNYRDVTSYALEQKLAEDLEFSYLVCDSYVDYVKRAFLAIKYYTNTTRVTTAIEHIDAAVKYEENNLKYSSIIEIAKVFPEV